MIKSKLKVLTAQIDKRMIDVSQGSGVNKDTLSKLYNNKACGINVDALDRLCSYFKCNPDDLFEVEKGDLSS